MVCWLGIDPGLSGGIAAYYPEQDCLFVEDMPTAGGLIDAVTLSSLIKEYAPYHAIVERAGAMPKQGVSSTFKFGVAFGAVLGALGALQIPFDLVSPAVWKKHFRLPRDKEKSRAMALRRFPASRGLGRKKDHNRAEAALLALYAYEVNNAQIRTVLDS